MEQQHHMILDKAHVSGEEEWYCPICGRRMLINWHPKFKKIVLEVGDNYAMHSATKGLVSNELHTAVSVNNDHLQVENNASIEDSRLSPWLEWFEQVDFDSLWDLKD